MRDPIGNNSIGAVVNAANAYTQGILENNKQTQSQFQQYFNYLKDKKTETQTEQKLDLEEQMANSKMANESYERENTAKKNELMGKELEHYDKNQALKEKTAKAQINASNAGAAVSYSNAKAINQGVQEKEDLKKMGAFSEETIQQNTKNKQGGGSGGGFIAGVSGVSSVSPSTLGKNHQKPKDEKFNAFASELVMQRF